MNPIRLSVVIPAFNEEASLEGVVCAHLRVLKAIESELVDWEIVCLDDASTDQTATILEGLAQKEQRIRVIRHSSNQGIYASFHDLFHAAKGTHIFQTAADDQWPAENLTRLFRAMVKGQYDLVIGVRENRREIYSRWRQILSFMFNWLPEVLFHVRTADANSIKMGVKKIFTLDLLSKSFFAEVERIIEAKRMGCRVGYERIEFLQRSGGKPSGAKWVNILTTLRDLLSYIVRNGIGARLKTVTRK